jgi:ubiquinone/menaquinone biosynthesis C-methylase UbiE
MSEDAVRKKIEADFHDYIAAKEQEDPASLTNKKFYAITRSSKVFIDRWLDEHCRPGVNVLDYCCGRGDVSLPVARRQVNLIGIDISPNSVETTRRRLAEEGLAARADIRVADAESTGLPDSHFDVIVCSGVLHHLELSSAFRELARVLKPTGKIICIEAMAHNPVFQAYRRRTPELRTEWETDHILGRQSIQLAGRYFENVEPHFFHLVDLMAVPFRNRERIFNLLLGILGGIDRLVLKLPGLRWWAWQCVFILSAPKKTRRAT